MLSGFTAELPERLIAKVNSEIIAGDWPYQCDCSPAKKQPDADWSIFYLTFALVMFFEAATQLLRYRSGLLNEVGSHFSKKRRPAFVACLPFRKSRRKRRVVEGVSQPTLPSREIPINFCASTANSIGNS